jgi:hypothetical protein
MLDSGALPMQGGARPHITVTIALADLQARVGNAGLLDFGDGLRRAPLSAADARRWACDAEVIPIVLGSHGEPLDVGRGERLVARGLRRALEQRDGGCAHPGCEIPGQWAVAHHIVHWAGGPAVRENLVLLCARHHTMIHKGEWVISMVEGFSLFHPPAWVGDRPLRNLIHRLDLLARRNGPRPAVPVARFDDLRPSHHAPAQVIDIRAAESEAGSAANPELIRRPAVRVMGFEDFQPGQPRNYRVANFDDLDPAAAPLFPVIDFDDFDPKPCPAASTDHRGHGPRR